MAPKRRRNHQKLKIYLPRSMAIPVVFVLGLSVGFAVNQFYHDSVIQLEPNQIKACFTPDGYCENSILSVINNAKQEILMQTYSFTSKPIADALILAQRRGVKVFVLYDQGAASTVHSQIPVLKQAGIQIFPEHTNGIAHNKIIIIDQEIVVTGSYNFTNAAIERNSENLIIVHNPELATQYVKNWEKLGRR